MMMISELMQTARYCARMCRLQTCWYRLWL